MIYSLWMEGYSATGDRSCAQFLGDFEGNSFMHAYFNYIAKQYPNEIPGYVRRDQPIIWGCRIFDNERDARKSFG